MRDYSPGIVSALPQLLFCTRFHLSVAICSSICDRIACMRTIRITVLLAEPTCPGSAGRIRKGFDHHPNLLMLWMLTAAVFHFAHHLNVPCSACFDPRGMELQGRLGGMLQIRSEASRRARPVTR
jgi:hypothetical protein